jgi:hypothetical protein
MSIAHEMIENAAFAYYPEKYEGRVLLILASNPAPYVDFLPGWRTVIPDRLSICYVDGHHRELITAQNAGDIAEQIILHLLPRTVESWPDELPLRQGKCVQA